MQLLKPRFNNPDGHGHGNVQYCIRTNDIEEVGDGTHLTFFQMVGSFGFGNHSYESHIDLWSSILCDLGIRVDYVDVHPDSPHRPYWETRKYVVHDNPGCLWSDGNIGGYCSELFVGNLEIGNLVNPLGHSVDVGFGYERLVQVIEGKDRVDETSLFRQDLDPVSRDHYRTLNVLYDQGIVPGNKGREYVCRRLLRRFIRLNQTLDPWMEPERERVNKSLQQGRRYWKRHSDKSPQWWWESFGILPEELELLR